MTTSEKPLVTTPPTLSASVMLKLKVPTVVGVPESVSFAKLMPGGRPLPGVKRYGGTPPVPPKVNETGVPTGTLPPGPPVMFSGAARMIIVKLPDPLEPSESVAAAEKENDPGVFGVPETPPPGERLNPSGKLPPASEIVKDPLPPWPVMEPE